MRSLKTGSALVVLAAGMLQAAGCFNSADDPELNPKLARGPFSNLSGSGGTSFSSSTGTGELPPECAGDPTKNATLVREECGVFVRADAVDAMEDGTRDHPYKTLKNALVQAGPRRIYACSSPKPYSEAVKITTAVEMYGGFDCNNWAWTVNGRSALDGPDGAVTLTLTKQAEGAKVQGFAITVADATAKGGSSIAVAVDDIAATLMNCEVKAGNGAVGEDGVTPAATATKGADAPQPDATKMNACINPLSLVEGTPGTTTCDGGGVTAGGKGGKGGITGTMGGDGTMGADGTSADGVSGKGGAGQAANVCGVGAPGKDGTEGAAGDPGHLPGALSLTGVISTDMTDGKPGSRGNGGGGGGGAKSGTFCTGSVDGNGASGGGGGAGGCGGKGGGGGKAGGSSIAILSLGAKLSLTNVSLETGNGGAGGKGAPGQNGGVAGLGGIGGFAASLPPSKPGCQGGNGGLGGSGGSGGGGRGGHSVGIAYAIAPNAEPVLKGFMKGMAGAGGEASPGNFSGKGSPGTAVACWDFGNNMACTK